MLKEYYGNRWEGMSVEEFLKLHNTKPLSEVYYFNVHSYSKIDPNQIDKWMEDLGLKSQSKVLIPADQLVDWEEVEESLGKEEAERLRKEKTGQYQAVDKDLQAGYMTLERLYHIPSYSNKVSSSMFYEDISPRRDEPIMGKGRYRSTGQKIDELSLSVLLSKNSKQFIKSFRDVSAREMNQEFLNNLLSLGLTITDNRGYNIGGSDLKNSLEKMKAKFRAKNNK